MDETMGTQAAQAAQAAGATRARRVLKGFAWTLLALAVAAIAVVAGMAWVNRDDRGPSEDVRALRAALAAKGPVPAHDDAYAALVALGHVDRAATAGSGSGIARPRRGERIDAAVIACEMPDADCPAALAAAERELAPWIARECGRLEAYRALLGRRGWYEPPPPDVDPMRWTAPPLGPVLEAQRLHLMQALLDARAGRVAVARDALEADMRFWRGALAGTRTLITRMIAAKAVRQNLRMGVHALARMPAGAVSTAVPAAWREPLTRAERSMLLPLAWEWALSDAHLRELEARTREENRAKGLSEHATKPFFKLQDTSNRGAARMRRIVAAHDVPYAGLRDSVARLGAELEDGTGFPIDLYNPIGRVLDAIAAPAYFDYGARVADLEAYRRAALAVAELHAAGVEPGARTRRLRASSWREPYAGEAFEWDAPAGCIRFRGLGRDRGRPHCLQPGDVPAIAPAIAATQP